MEPDTSGMDKYGNIIGLLDCTRQAYDFEKLWKQNRDSLLGRYIETLRDYPEEVSNTRRFTMASGRFWRQKGVNR